MAREMVRLILAVTLEIKVSRNWRQMFMPTDRQVQGMSL